MRIADAAPTFFNDPGLKSQAIAKAIMVFAKRLNAGDEHMTQLSDLMANISTSRSSGAAPVSADGGGARAAADVSGDVEM
eukprot:7309898-Alexandrium_andersonii.AAC.1